MEVIVRKSKVKAITNSYGTLFASIANQTRDPRQMHEESGVNVRKWICFSFIISKRKDSSRA